MAFPTDLQLCVHDSAGFYTRGTQDTYNSDDNVSLIRSPVNWHRSQEILTEDTN